MSASSKKKLRKEEHMAKLTERQLAEQKEAKKLKTNTIVFITAIALIMVVGIGLLCWNWYSSTGIAERNTKAVKIGNHTLSVAELNYYYVDHINSVQQDSNALMELSNGDGGLNYTDPLNKQLYKNDANKTWGDYFIEEAIKEASGVLALCDAADKAGFTLSAEEIATIDDTMIAMETQGTLNQFSSLNKFLQAIYGKGANEKTYRAYIENVTLAQSYYNHYTEELTYTAQQIADYEKENGTYSSFDYTYFQVSPDTFMEHEEGSTEHNHSEEDKAAALEQAKKTADELVELVKNSEAENNKEDLDKAIASLQIYNPDATVEDNTEETTEEKTEDKAEEKAEETTEEETEETTEEETEETTEEETEEETEETTEEETEETTDSGESTEASTVPTSTEHTDYPYTYINSAIGEWLTGSEHESGDIASVPYYTLDEEGNKTDTVESYYVVIFGNENKHLDKMVTVRHILKNYEGGTANEETGEMEYTDAEKEAAQKEIDKIKAEWEAGEKTEESFGKLAKEHTDDSNGDQGGLYEHVYPGWAVEEFDAWCFAEDRKPGDVEAVLTQFGCHLIYFVGVEDQTYRDYMVTYDMRAEDSAAWFEELKESYSSTAKALNTSLLNTDIILTPNVSIS